MRRLISRAKTRAGTTVLCGPFIRVQMTINNYLKGLCDFTIIQNLVVSLENYHHTNEAYLYYTCKLLRRVLSIFSPPP